MDDSDSDDTDGEVTRNVDSSDDDGAGRRAKI